MQTRRRFGAAVLGVAALAVLLSEGGRAGAGPITYTFEAPNFTVGQTTPILNAPPNVGPSTFTTSFVDVATPAGYTISPPGPPPLSGQFLIALTSTDPLLLSFNTPVTALSVDFFLNASAIDSPGFLRLTTLSGSFDQPGSPNFALQSGTLAFSSPVPFTEATLQGFGPDGQSPTQISIDNLSLTPTGIPEPTSLALLGLGGAVLAVWRQWRRRATA
jgi:hypothetical protein